jgi:hypothetical protein
MNEAKIPVNRTILSCGIVRQESSEWPFGLALLTVPSTQKVNPTSQFHPSGRIVSEPTGGHLLKGDADTPKHRDLFWRLAAWLKTGNDFSQFGMNRSGTQACASHRSHF